VNLIHCISQSEKPEAVPHALEWCKKEFGEHVFKPSLIVLDADSGTFDCVHTEFTKYVNLYVPFFGYTLHVWNEFKIRNPALTTAKTPMIKILMFYMKLLPFLRIDMVRNRYLDIKRIF
jgi:hypothetical protein